MGLAEILAAAFALSMDAFSVCVASAVKIKTPSLGHYARFSAGFGLFQFIMPVVGWHAGSALESLISKFDHWIAFSLLLLIGLNMIRESLFAKKISYAEKRQEKHPVSDPSKGLTLLMLSIATSIDAAAVGFSLSALNVPVLKPAAIIGAVCAACSAAGVFIGKRAGTVLGGKAGFAGGVVLIAIGVKILIEHIAS